MGESFQKNKKLPILGEQLKKCIFKNFPDILLSKAIYKSKEGVKMRNGRKKIMICLITVFLMAIAVGVLYYATSDSGSSRANEGTLITQDICNRWNGWWK